MRKRAGKQGIRALRPAPSEEAPTERRQKNKPGQQRCRETEQQSAKQMIVGEGQSYGLEKKGNQGSGNQGSGLEKMHIIRRS